jgi:hypothetical protein
MTTVTSDVSARTSATDAQLEDVRRARRRLWESSERASDAASREMFRRTHHSDEDDDEEDARGRDLTTDDAARPASSPTPETTSSRGGGGGDRGFLYSAALGAGLLGHHTASAFRSIASALSEASRTEPEPSTQMERDEAYARRLHARYQRELAAEARNAARRGARGESRADRYPTGSAARRRRTAVADAAAAGGGGGATFSLNTPCGSFSLRVGGGGATGLGHPDELASFLGQHMEQRARASGAGAGAGEFFRTFFDVDGGGGGGGDEFEFSRARGDGLTFESLSALAEELGVGGTPGVARETLDTFPTHAHSCERRAAREKEKGEGEEESGRMNDDAATASGCGGGGDDDAEESTTCPVCMADVEDGDVLRTLPCLHAYHAACIDRWLEAHKTCPVCKFDVTSGVRPHLD